MRTWRKLYSKILESDQVAALSLESKWLLTLLIAAQDDTGYYPWTKTKVLRLTPTCPDWTFGYTTDLANQLTEAGLTTWEEGGIVLLSGKSLNGKYRKDIEDDLYQRSQTTQEKCAEPVTEPEQPRAEPVTVMEQGSAARVDQSRVDQSRVERPAARALGGGAPSSLITGLVDDFLDPSQIPR